MPPGSAEAPNRRNARAGALAALAFSSFAISWSPIFVRWARLPGVSSAFYRVLIASGCLWSFRAFYRPRRVAKLTIRELLLTGLGGLFFAGDLGCYNTAVLHTGAGSATFLGNNAPLFVGLLAWLITRKQPPRRFWIAVALACVGGALIVLPDLRGGGRDSSADLLAVLASVCFALYLLVTERLRAKLDALTLLAVSSSASAVALLAISWTTGASLKIADAEQVGALVGLGLVAQVGGYAGVTYALGTLPATVCSVVLLAVAPLTAVLAWLCFHERMTGGQMAGGALILLAVLLVSGASGDGRGLDPASIPSL